MNNITIDLPIDFEKGQYLTQSVNSSYSSNLFSPKEQRSPASKFNSLNTNSSKFVNCFNATQVSGFNGTHRRWTDALNTPVTSQYPIVSDQIREKWTSLKQKKVWEVKVQKLKSLDHYHSFNPPVNSTLGF